MVQRCADLFFFYQEAEPFARLQEHDYGFYQYEPFLNYLTHGKKSDDSDKALIDLADLTEDHAFLRPIFRQRE